MADYFRKIIKVSATDSPNVQWALRQLAAGQQPDGREVIAGVLSWSEYQHRLVTWDAVRRCIGLDGEFYQGAVLLLFPPDWLNVAERNWETIKHASRKAQAIGCDPGEGGANSSWSVVDDLGVIELLSEKTPDTTDVTSITLELMDKWNVPANKVGFDAGGGGKQHADRMRSEGHQVRAIRFGAAPSLALKRGLRLIEERKEMVEEAYVYTNMRVQMAHELSQLCDPALNKERGLPGFAIPPGITAGNALCHTHGLNCLRAQLAVLPKQVDKEGRWRLPPKNKQSADSKEPCLVDMVGHSPDEADSLFVAVHVMLHEVKPAMAGAF